MSNPLAEQAVKKMVSPGQKRQGKWRGGVIQIHVTRACDKACFGCTQGSQLAGNPGMITVDQFEQCCESLKGYPGVVGVFGGNPAMHPKFGELCEVLREHIPFEQCGLWCNNPLGKGAEMQKTFNPRYSNLNVHLDAAAFDEFKRDWPESKPFGLDKDSRHSPVYTAMRDYLSESFTEADMWDRIANCDINKHWSAMVGVFRGETRAWFCEIAGAQSILHQDDPEYPDTGVQVTPNWWRRPLESFQHQVEKHCPECGVPLRGKGVNAQSKDPSDKEQVSVTHKDIFSMKGGVTNRPVELVSSLYHIGVNRLERFTDYVQNRDKE